LAGERVSDLSDDKAFLIESVHLYKPDPIKHDYALETMGCGGLGNRGGGYVAC
jgi:hypothetical protein